MSRVQTKCFRFLDLFHFQQVFLCIDSSLAAEKDVAGWSHRYPADRYAWGAELPFPNTAPQYHGTVPL